MTRTRSAVHKSSPPGPAGASGSPEAASKEAAASTADPGAGGSTGDAVTSRPPPLPAAAADRGRRNPPRSSRGCKTIGRDYADLVKPLTAPTKTAPAEHAAASSSARAAPPGPPPPPPPALTLRTVIIDGVIKEARCGPFVPPKTKLTLRRTKHGWGVTSRAAAAAAAARAAAASSSASPAATVGAAPEPEPTETSDVVMPEVDDEELTQRLRQLYSRNKSTTSQGSRQSDEDDGAAPAATGNGSSGCATQTAEKDAEEMPATAQRDGSTVRETIDTLAKEGVESGPRDQAVNGVAATEANDQTVNVSANKDDSEVGCGSDSDIKVVKTEPRVSLKSEFGLSMIGGDTPQIYPPPMISVPKIRLGGNAITFSAQGAQERDNHSHESAPHHQNPPLVTSRKSPHSAGHSPMLASLLEGTQSATEADRTGATDTPVHKSCELLKHLLSSSAGGAPKDHAGVVDFAKGAFNKLKFHNRDSQHFDGGKSEPSEKYEAPSLPAKAVSPLDPKCKLTPSPVSTPPSVGRTNSSGTLWNFLNDPKVGIPETLLIPVSRLKLLLSQPLVELANLSTFTAEAVKYIGWHPAFRSVDILRVSRDRLYKLLKDPRNEVKQLLVDPQARLYPCRRPGGWAGSRPPGMVPLSAAGARFGSATPAPSTTSLLRQKLMTRGGGPLPEYGTHCNGGFNPAAAFSDGSDGGGGGGGRVATAGAAVAFRPPMPVLAPLHQGPVRASVNRVQQNHLLGRLLKQPLSKQAFLTDEVTIHPIPTQAAVPRAQLKRCLPDLIPRSAKRRGPPGLRPLGAAPGPQLEAELPPCPDSDGEDGPTLIAANFVQTCMEEPEESPQDAAETPQNGPSSSGGANSGGTPSGAAQNIASETKDSANECLDVISFSEIVDNIVDGHHELSKSAMLGPVGNSASANQVKEQPSDGKRKKSSTFAEEETPSLKDESNAKKDDSQKPRLQSRHDDASVQSRCPSDLKPKSAETSLNPQTIDAEGKVEYAAVICDNDESNSALQQAIQEGSSDRKCSDAHDKSDTPAGIINTVCTDDAARISNVSHTALRSEPASASAVPSSNHTVSLNAGPKVAAPASVPLSDGSSSSGAVAGDTASAGSGVTPGSATAAAVATPAQASIGAGASLVAASPTTSSETAANSSTQAATLSRDQPDPVSTNSMPKRTVKVPSRSSPPDTSDEVLTSSSAASKENQSSSSSVPDVTSNTSAHTDLDHSRGGDFLLSEDAAGDDAESGDEEDRLVINEDDDGASEVGPDTGHVVAASAAQDANVSAQPSVGTDAEAPAGEHADPPAAGSAITTSKSTMMTADTAGSTRAAEPQQNGVSESLGDRPSPSDKGAQNAAGPTGPAEEETPPAASEKGTGSESTPAAVQNGQNSPPAATDAAPGPAAVTAPSEPPSPRPTGAPGASQAGSGKRSSEAAAGEEPTRKAPRLETETERATPLTLDAAAVRTVELIEASLHKLRREVKAIDLLSRQKEKEWDNLLKLRKAKEETFQRLRRKREVLLMQQVDSDGASAQRAATSEPRPLSTAASSAVVTSAAAAAAAAQLGQKQRAAAAAALLAQQSGLASLRPVRPAAGSPFSGGAPGGGGGQIGMGPQGPTISVRHLIENHRAAGAGGPDTLLRRPPAEPGGPQDPQYRDVLANIAKLSKQASAVVASAAAAAAATTPSGEVTIQQVGPPASAGLSEQATSQPQSSLARLLMESKMKQVEPNVLNEMLKPQHSPQQRPAVTVLPRIPPQPQQQPQPQQLPQQPRPGAEEVPLCQGCRVRPAQFVCAGCGNQWYCSRECQVEAWDAHADECSG